MVIQDGLYGGGASLERRNTKSTLPPGLPTPEEIDALIAREMTRMTMEEREKVLSDVHGIAEVEEEDPAFVSLCLVEFEDHLTTIKQDTAYALAEAMSRQYVSAKGFRMMFLRADRYAPTDAAERMVRFFELKKSLFGAEKLVKDITLDDLEEDDLDTLETGCVQVSPLTDMTGRPIFVVLPKLRGYKVVENYRRASFYAFMSIAESPGAQKRGLVAVYYCLDHFNIKSVNDSLRKSVPLHLASIHVCYNDENEFTPAWVAIRAQHTKHRVRYRSHFGSHLQCQHALSSFGITRESLPVTQEGSLLTDQHMHWLQKRREIEAERASIMGEEGAIATECFSNARLSIYPIDVLFGRGKSVTHHPGNVQFRQLIDYYIEKYEIANTLAKTCIAEIVLQMVKENSGRFLRKKDSAGDWEEVDDDTARNKVSYAFRNRRKTFCQ